MKINVKTDALTEDMMQLTSAFCSGNEFLDQFIKSRDALNNGIGKTFVWINDEKTEIIGYYNIGVGYIDMYDGDDKYKIGGSIHLNFLKFLTFYFLIL